MKLVLLAAVLSVCMLMSSAYPSQRQRQRQRQRQDVRVSNWRAMMSSLFDVLQQSIEEVEAEGKKGYQIGTAIVGSGANGKNSKCPSEDIGMSATGQANGCEHDHCTAAKNAARATLRNQVDKECHKYITSTSPCEKVNCD